MADNDTPKIRYDDFVSSVQPDPAKPESTIMLSGFVGHGAEGHARIYPDPTLGTWYDVPEGDVVHSMPIADSKLGGSYVWVRASADIKPGRAAPAATETVRPQQAAAPAEAAWTMLATRCICAAQPAVTPAAICNAQPRHGAAMAAPGQGVPTFVAGCFGPTFSFTMGPDCPTVACPTIGPCTIICR